MSEAEPRKLPNLLGVTWRLAVAALPSGIVLGVLSLVGADPVFAVIALPFLCLPAALTGVVLGLPLYLLFWSLRWTTAWVFGLGGAFVTSFIIAFLPEWMLWRYGVVPDLQVFAGDFLGLFAGGGLAGILFWGLLQWHPQQPKA